MLWIGDMIEFDTRDSGLLKSNRKDISELSATAKDIWVPKLTRIFLSPCLLKTAPGVE